MNKIFKEFLLARDSKIKCLCVNGLEIDGAHHKQWFLEQIMREVLPVNESVATVKAQQQAEGFDWEEGIAP